MRIDERLRRMEARSRASAERGDQRHHEIDERFATIEANTARIAQLEADVSRLLDAVKLPKVKVN